MEEKKIDTVNAEDLQPRDLIMVGLGFQTVKSTEVDGDFILVYTEEEGTDTPALEISWDTRVTLYGY